MRGPPTEYSHCMGVCFLASFSLSMSHCVRKSGEQQRSKQRRTKETRVREERRTARFLRRCRVSITFDGDPVSFRFCGWYYETDPGPLGPR